MMLQFRKIYCKLYSGLLFVLFQVAVSQAQVSSQNPIILPQNGGSSLIIESGQTYTAKSAVSITLLSGVHFKSGSSVLLSINSGMTGPAAPNNPNENSNMNWTLARSFNAAGGVIGETKSFFDDNGQVLQTQTKNIDAGHVLAVQPLYDVAGQAIGSTMSAPINNAAFNYKSDFAKGPAGTSIDYRNYSLYINGTKEHKKNYLPDPVDQNTIGTVGWYYSTNNEWERLQDITAYPYSTSTGAANGTNVISISGGVGNVQKLGSGHEAKQFSVPVSRELDFYNLVRRTYFPTSELGDTSLLSTAKKIMSVNFDGDNRATVSVSIDGKTVMTGREGDHLLLQGNVIVPKGTSRYFGVLKAQNIYFAGGTLKDYFLKETVATLGSGNRMVQPGLYQLTAGAFDIGATYQIGLSDVSFTFYDQLGRVKATIPPEGVKQLWTSGVGSFASLASIPFVQTFKYDGKGNLIESVSPDAGKSEIKYSSDGKLRFSQNALQRLKKKFSYTNYDQYGRTVESGELLPSGTLTFAGIAAVLLDANGIAADTLLTGTRSDVTVIKYDSAETVPTLSTYVQDSYFLSGSAVSNKARYSGAVSEANLVAKTWYNYDGNGNVLWTVKYAAGLGYKTMDYTYDDLGNVTKSIYQKGTATETLVHYFEYDKNNRLVSTYTNTTDNGASKVLHAKYSYYLHGPLKRVELGDKLQGLDYVYGIDGKLKSINNANATKDPGSDGGSNGFAADVFGMNFEYHSGDYSNTVIGLPSIQTNSTTQYFSGNINGISWFSRKPNSADVAPVMNTYAYDAAGQLQQSNWGTPNYTSKTFLVKDSINQERDMRYDGHGNLLALKRSNASSITVNNFTYNYQSNTNKLTSVTGYANYTYDAIGQLASQVKGSAGMYLDYDVSGKVTKIYSNAAKSTVILSFVYDDDGNRIQKKDHRNNAVTYYSYDGSGTLAAIFEQLGTGPIQLTEQPIYGADRLGTLFRQANNYQYTISDHVGNTRVVINRNKLAGGSADIVYYADYYPFGTEVRSGGIDSRYGYQGLYAEKDKETGWNNFELRNYDSAIGRWLTTDPYGQYNSPYVGMGNNPVSGFDPNGGWNIGGWFKSLFSSKENAAHYLIDEVSIPYPSTRGEITATKSNYWRNFADSKSFIFRTAYTILDQPYVFLTGFGNINNAKHLGGHGADPNEYREAAIMTASSAIGPISKSITFGSTFYRAMSYAEYAALQANDGLTYMVGKELFVSMSESYSRAYLKKTGYDVLVKFNMKSSAMNYFNQVGVLHRTKAGASGWAGRGNFLWKSEGGIMNLGIQSNPNIFNKWIQSYKIIK